MKAKIYRPTKTAMQSGKGNTKKWVLEPILEDSEYVDPMIGWTSNSDTKRQSRLEFDNQAEAEKYAKSHKIDYIVIEPKTPKLIKQAYADNFI